MADEFKIEVPIDVKGKSSSSNSGSDGPSFKKLAGAVAAGSLATKALSVALDGLATLLSPLLNILKVLFIVIFLPFMPLIKTLTEAIAKLIPGITKLFGGKIDLAQFIKQYVGPFLSVVLKAIAKSLWDMIKAIVVAFYHLGQNIGDWLYDKVITPVADVIASGIEFILNIFTTAGKSVWNAISFVGKTLGNIGVNIWNFILKGLQFVANIGRRIWDFFLDALSSISNLGQKIWNWIRSALSNAVHFLGFANGGRPPTNQVSIVGERGPELFIPDGAGTIIPNNKLGGAGTININVTGNKFNSEQDMRKMVDMISNRLQKVSNRRFS